MRCADASTIGGSRYRKRSACRASSGCEAEGKSGLVLRIPPIPPSQKTTMTHRGTAFVRPMLVMGRTSSHPQRIGMDAVRVLIWPLVRNAPICATHSPHISLAPAAFSPTRISPSCAPGPITHSLCSVASSRREASAGSQSKTPASRCTEGSSPIRASRSFRYPSTNSAHAPICSKSSTSKPSFSPRRTNSRSAFS